MGSTLLDHLWGNAEGRRRFESRLPASAQTQLQSLAAESNPEIFFADLLNLATQLEQNGNPEAAFQIHASVAALLEQAPQTLQPLRARARNACDALLGQGTFGRQSEILVRKFCHEAMDPAAIVAMGLGTQAFRLGRLFAASRLGTASLASEALAAGTGFLAETTTFTLAQKGVSAALGRWQDWSPEALGRDWASGALVLGSLKTMGVVSRYGLQQYMGSAALTRLAAESGIHSLAVRALPQLATLSGILIGHDLQEYFGLRERTAGGKLFAGLTTLLQLHVGSGIMSSVFGGGYQGEMTELALRMEDLRGVSKSTDLPPGPAVELASAQEAVVATHYRDPRLAPRPMLMLGKGGETNKTTKRLWTPEEMTESASFLVGLSLPTKLALSDIYNSPEGQLRMGSTLRHHTFTDMKALERGLCRLGYAIKHAKEGKAEGTYVDWLTRTVFEDMVDHLDSARADRLVHFLAEGGSLQDFEAMLAKDLPNLSFSRFAAWLPEHFRAKNPHHVMIQMLPLPQDLRNILFRWAYAQSEAKEPSRFHQSEPDLIKSIMTHQWNRMGVIRSILEAAAKSPLGTLRLKRLHQVLSDPEALEDFNDLKLLELADTDYRLLGSNVRHLPFAWFRSPPSQFNAYLGSDAPEALLREIQKNLPSLLDPEQAQKRSERRKDSLQVLEIGRPRFGGMDQLLLATAFDLLGDPYSKAIAKSLRNRDFDVQVLPDREYDEECRRLSTRLEPDKSSAQYFAPGEDRPKGLMLIRERAFDHYSAEVAPDSLFVVMGKVAHEYQHFLDMHPKLPDTARNRLWVEMKAHLRDALWKAEHGETGKLATFARDGMHGMALHYRNEFEQVYGGIFKNQP